MNPDLIRLTALLAIGAAAVWYDVKLRRIPNGLTVMAGVGGLLFALLTAGAGAGWHAAHLVVALAIGMLFFALRWIGGGDAKLYAGFAAWFPLAHGWALGSAITVCGIVLLLAWFPLVRLRPAQASERGIGHMRKLPYGIAVSAGAILTQAWVMALAAKPLIA